MYLATCSIVAYRRPLVSLPEVFFFSNWSYLLIQLLPLLISSKTSLNLNFAEKPYDMTL